MVSQLGIQKDIEKLERLVQKKASGLISTHPEELVQVHVFNLVPKKKGRVFSKAELLDYSFLKELKCKYKKTRLSRFIFKKYLDGCTFLLTPSGQRLERYKTGHSCFYIDSGPISKEVWSTDNSTFLFFNFLNPNAISDYFLVKNDSLYYYEDYGDQLIPFEQFLQTHYTPQEYQPSNQKRTNPLREARRKRKLKQKIENEEMDNLL